MLYKNFIFDCDGVLLDSNKFKVSAMRTAISSYPETAAKDFIEYFTSNFGKSRYMHVKLFFEVFLGRPPADGEQQAILEKYARACREEYQTCEICTGAIELLTLLSPDNCWVVSGSDQEELRGVFSSRNLRRHFKDVLGSPTAKSTNIAKIIETNNLEASTLCIIGDSSGDYQAARDNDIDFIFCRNYSNTPELGEKYAMQGLRVISNLQELAQEISP
ncbi:hypothetical protein PKB_1192 [Pseudomonas knackmussii B13]|uniref:phosphoglycolate phosphatase n=2 Tax=Pseudomonas knackmussii TaxID=65741 RepID=A0A024HDH1_PSEKB|nr:HAD hydrolase-like protein [Pseudomonas knackmussii]CDF82557.1 hypothetical protein PKB_1192 [Pseudomonas knackmussii B13]